LIGRCGKAVSVTLTNLTIIDVGVKYCGVATESNTLTDLDVAPVFEALVDPIRREVVQLLGDGPRLAGELAKASGVTPSAMSRHLRILLETGLVSAERRAEDARVRVFRLRPESMTALRVWLDELQARWTGQLESFKAHVETEHGS
jgi:DNA-binding transcriptional ArsR family regulator